MIIEEHSKTKEIIQDQEPTQHSLNLMEETCLDMRADYLKESSPSRRILDLGTIPSQQQSPTCLNTLMSSRNDSIFIVIFKMVEHILMEGKNIIILLTDRMISCSKPIIFGCLFDLG